MKTLAGSFFAFALAIACGAKANQRMSCRKAWQPLIQYGLHKYHHQKDERRTPFGNQGYSNSWKARVAKVHPRRDCVKDWTFLVYMSADNDLHPFALADIYEMEAGYSSDHFAGSTLKTDLLVHVDTRGDEGSRLLHIFESPDLYDGRLGLQDFQNSDIAQARSPIVSLWGEERITESERFERFLRWGIKNYPAKHYAVVVWGHGQGWVTKTTQAHNPNLRGFLFNDQSPAGMSVPTLREVLQRVSDQDLEGRAFDLYISDACLMQQMEVAFELADVARFIVASPKVHNYFGLPYRRIFNRFNRGDHLGYKQRLFGKGLKFYEVDEAMLLAYMIPDLFRKSFHVRRGGQGLQGRFDSEGYKELSVTSLSAGELKYIVYPQFLEFSQVLLEYVKGRPLRQHQLVSLLSQTPLFSPGLKDLGLFLEGLLQEIEKKPFPLFRPISDEDKEVVLRLRRAILDLDERLTRAVINRAIGVQFALDKHYGFSGVSLWLPGRPDMFESRYVNDYQKALFFAANESGKNPWALVLETIFRSEF